MHVWGPLSDLCRISVAPGLLERYSWIWAVRGMSGERRGSPGAPGYLKGILGFEVSGGCPGELRGRRGSPGAPGYLEGVLGFGVSDGCPGELRGAPDALRN